MSASNTGSMLSAYTGPNLLTALRGKNVHRFLPSKRNIQKWEAKASTCKALPTAALGARNRLGQLFLRWEMESVLLVLDLFINFSQPDPK